MRIFILRHAEAEPIQEAGSDEERALTEKGIKRLHRAGKGLRRLNIFPDRILSSPYKRALQTARIVAEELGFTGEIECVEELLPESSPQDVVDVLRRMDSVNQVLLVGHQPLLGEVVGHLIGAPSAEIGIKKGGLVRVDVEGWSEDPPGELRYLLTGKQLCWLKRKKQDTEED